DEIEAFIGRNPSADDQEDMFSGKDHGLPASLAHTGIGAGRRWVWTKSSPLKRSGRPSVISSPARRSRSEPERLPRRQFGQNAYGAPRNARSPLRFRRRNANHARPWHRSLATAALCEQ